MKTTNVFGDDSDSENETKTKPIQVPMRINMIYSQQLLYFKFYIKI